MTRDEMQNAAEYWEEKDAAAVRMPRDELISEMERFITAHTTCALATGAGSFVRCTPIEYNYKDGRFFLFTEGGRKFTALMENSNVSLCIYNEYAGFGTAAGMQVTGKASFIEPWSERYIELLEFKHIKPEALKKQPHQLHLIEIAPSRIDYLNAEFKKRGYDSRQHAEFPAEQ